MISSVFIKFTKIPVSGNCLQQSNYGHRSAIGQCFGFTFSGNYNNKTSYPTHTPTRKNTSQGTIKSYQN
jgi:hypothetical protein